MSVWIRIGKPIGRGSFGSIYEAEDNLGKVTGAMKRIPLSKKEGIPSLIESSIMSSYFHPYINRTRLINVRQEDLYLVQDLADSDLSVRVRKSKGGTPLSLEELRLWCFQLLQAVAFLHERSIVHGDIKTSNVLVYGENLRLSDFTLSRKIWTPGSKISGRTCTMIYRAPEIWIEELYDLQSDIWSLGCTFYEMAYGELLFPPQEKHKEDDRKILRPRFIGAILEWGLRTGQRVPRDTSSPYRPAGRIDDRIVPAQFNALLLRMLKIDPDQRSTAAELLQDPLFADLKMTEVPKIFSTVRREVPESTLARVRTKLRKLLKEPMIQKLALDFFIRSYRLDLPQDQKVVGCAWIASKIFKGSAFPTTIPIDTMIETERKLCFHLDYRLHEILE